MCLDNMSCRCAEDSELTTTYSGGNRTAIEAVYRVGTHSAHGRTTETENKRPPLAFRAWFAKSVRIVYPCLNKYSQANFSETIDPKRRFGKEELRVEENLFPMMPEERNMLRVDLPPMFFRLTPLRFARMSEPDVVKTLRDEKAGLQVESQPVVGNQRPVDANLQLLFVLQRVFTPVVSDDRNGNRCLSRFLPVRFCSHLFNLMIQNLNRLPRILFRDAALGIDPDKIRSLFG